MMRFLIALAAIAGIASYFSLGRQEDPVFANKHMMVSAQWPGASAPVMAEQVTDRLELAIQSITELDYTTSTTRAGHSIIKLKLREDTSGPRVREVWTRVRQRISDVKGQLPDGVINLQFYDDFDDIFGNIYAVTGTGYTYVQLKRYADQLRHQLRALPDAARVEIEGAQTERIYIEFSSSRIQGLGISPEQIVQSLQEASQTSPSGLVDAGAEQVRVDVSGAFTSVRSIRNLGIEAEGKSFRLGDFAEVSRGLEDPRKFQMRVNGEPAVGLLATLRAGGNVSRFGEQIERTVAKFEAELPIGLAVHTVSNQPAVVEKSIDEFTNSLLEAILIVLAVSFLSLGWRSGLVVGLCVPIVLALTFATMLAFDIYLQRISLGALIIALGLLVDDAIIVVEQIETHLHQGWDRIKAASSAYLTTAQPMLIGTLIMMFGFLPVSMAQSDAGSYTRSIFQVVAIALIFSWIVAVFVTPFLASKLLKTQPTNHQENIRSTRIRKLQERFQTGFRGFLHWTLQNRTFTIIATAGAFILSIALLAVAVPQQFFPASDRPELVVDFNLSENATFSQTSAVVARMENALVDDEDISHLASYVGGGTRRFYISLAVQIRRPGFAQMVIQTKGEKARDRVQRKIERLFASGFPEVRGRVSALELGPSLGQPVKIRLSGRDYADISNAADQVEALLRDDLRLTGVNQDYGEEVKTLRIEMNQNTARALGVTRLDIQQGLQTALEGQHIAWYREDNRALQIVARLKTDERTDLSRLPEVKIITASGKAVPIAQLATIVSSFEPAVLNRRSRMPTITVQADVIDVQPADVTTGLAPQFDEIRDSLPVDASLTVGGAQEESIKAEASVAAVAPVALILIVVLLMIQVHSLKITGLVLVTGPLAVIGVAIIFAIFQIPFGFVAMLGTLALFGMVVRNSLILVTRIDDLKAQDFPLYDALVESAMSRFRPIMLTAIAAILAMVPLTRSSFWGPMAWAIMGGLMVATVLTLVFLPAIYAIAYRAPYAAGTRGEDNA